MLKDDAKTNMKFKIAFGNLKQDFKDNYYLATTEKSVENSIVECVFIAEQNNDKYAIAVEDFMGVKVTKYINLNYFEEWHYICIREDKGKE